MKIETARKLGIVQGTTPVDIDRLIDENKTVIVPYGVTEIEFLWGIDRLSDVSVFLPDTLVSVKGYLTKGDFLSVLTYKAAETPDFSMVDDTVLDFSSVEEFEVFPITV